MKYRKIDDNTLAIYVSEQDIYDKDLDLTRLLTTDQKAVQEVIRNILQKIDPEGEFFDSGQLSIQMMPKNKGIFINVQKLDVDENADEETIAKAINNHSVKVMDDMKSLMKVMDELVAEQAKEDEYIAKNRIAYILGSTTNFEDIIQLAKMNIEWNTSAQYIYSSSNKYYVFFKYPKGSSEDNVNRDFMLLSDWIDFETESCEKILSNAKMIIQNDDQHTALQKINKQFS